MDKYNVEFNMEINVSFEDEDEAENYFCFGDWKNTFWDLDDVEDLARSIAENFHGTPDSWNRKLSVFTRFVEGFGEFVQIESGKWQLSDEFIQYGGQIFVEYEMELEAGFVSKAR